MINKHNRPAWLFVILGICFFGYNVAIAGGYHHHEPDIINTTEVINNYSVKGVASAISAAQCHFDGGSFDLQLCGGYGNSSGQDAYTFGVGQKVGDFLLNFTETTENGKSSHGFGINWKVKFK